MSDKHGLSNQAVSGHNRASRKQWRNNGDKYMIWNIYSQQNNGDLKSHVGQVEAETACDAVAIAARRWIPILGFVLKAEPAEEQHGTND